MKTDPATAVVNPEARRFVSTLVEINHEITSILDLDELLKKIAELTNRIVPFEIFAIFLVDDEKQELYLRFAIGHEPDVVKNLRIKIGDGVTGTAGHVDEPYLDGTIRPEILFPAYVSGRNLAEAFYAAMPYLSWQTVVIGDPLCAPFDGARRTADEIDPGFDANIGLPSLFAKQRLDALPRGLKQDAAVAYVRATSRAEDGDLKGAREDLETAIIADGTFSKARLELAGMQERDGQIDRAIANYRAVIQREPNQSVALNNLAMLLANQQGKPEEALPYAERAVAITKNEPPYLDTLAWTQHLMGADKLALNAIRAARVLGGNDPEIVWHAAVIYAKAGEITLATAELKALLAVAPALAERPEVKKLQEQLTSAK